VFLFADEAWRSLERGKATIRVNITTPSSKFLKSISNPKLLRTSASTILQLRLAHIPLNSYLKRIHKVNYRRKSLYQGCPKNVHTMLYLPSISIEVHKYDGPQAIYGKWPGRAYLCIK
jgi:hypothetical protein